MTRNTAENCGVRQTAFRAPAIRSAGVRIPIFFHERTTPDQSAQRQNDMMPAAPSTDMMGVALNMKRAAFHDMKVAAKTQTPNTRAGELRLRSPLQSMPPPTIRANKKVIGPNEANSWARCGAFASATVPKILVLAKYPLPENNTSHPYQMLRNWRRNSTEKKIKATTPRVPNTSSQGLSRNPVVM